MFGGIIRRKKIGEKIYIQIAGKYFSLYIYPNSK
jgi:hypothetical protein